MLNIWKKYIGLYQFPLLVMFLSAEKIVEIEQATVGQAEHPLWQAPCKGRIAASNFYKVKTKVESLRKAGTNAVSSKKLVASLIG